MEDISNRKIFADTLVSFLAWLSVTLLLAAILWWATGFITFSNPSWRGPIIGSLSGVGAYLIASFIGRRRNAQRT